MGISSCLLGEKVRYDGNDKRSPVIAEWLSPHVEWVPVCPELEAGMGVPREPLRLVGVARAPPRMVGVETGTDWTDRMRDSARARLAALLPLSLGGYILKSRSPSCGLRVAVHASREAAVPIPGAASAGLFAALLVEHFPGLPIEEETGLEDPAACGRFLERVRAYGSSLLGKRREEEPVTTTKVR